MGVYSHGIEKVINMGLKPRIPFLFAQTPWKPALHFPSLDGGGGEHTGSGWGCAGGGLHGAMAKALFVKIIGIPGL